MNKKRVFAAFAAVLLVGAGSAAVIDYFGHANGTVSVDNQAISVDGTTGFSVDGSAAPDTFDSEIGVTNNNDDRFVDYSFQVDTENDDVDNADEVVREVYKQQSVKAHPQDSSSKAPATIQVTPNVDEVTYDVSLPDNYQGGNVDLEFSRNGADNYHVKYYPQKQNGVNSDNWGIQDSSSSGTLEPLDVDQVEEVRSVDTVETDTDGYVEELEVTVSREIGYSQTFGANIYDGDEFFKTNSSDGTTFTYSDSSQDSHSTVDFSDYLDEGTLTVEPSEDVNYSLGVYVDSNADPSSTYNVGVSVASEPNQ